MQTILHLNTETGWRGEALFVPALHARRLLLLANGQLAVVPTEMVNSQVPNMIFSVSMF